MWYLVALSDITRFLEIFIFPHDLLFFCLVQKLLYGVSEMAMFEAVPVVEIDADNLKQLWPTLVLAINSSSFLAIDAVSISDCCPHPVKYHYAFSLST